MPDDADLDSRDETSGNFNTEELNSRSDGTRTATCSSSRMNQSQLLLIEKLKGASNYASWKFDVKMALMYEGIWNCVKPEEGKAVDKEKDGRAFARIALLLDSAPKAFIRTASTAKEAWELLETKYETKSVNRRIGLLNQVFDLTLAYCSDLEDYTSQFANLANQLSDIGKPLDDEMQACLLLRGYLIHTLLSKWQLKILELL